MLQLGSGSRYLHVWLWKGRAALYSPTTRAGKERVSRDGDVKWVKSSFYFYSNFVLESVHISKSHSPAVTHRCWESYARVISIWGFLLWTGHSPRPAGPPVPVVGGPGWRIATPRGPRQVPCWPFLCLTPTTGAYLHLPLLAQGLAQRKPLFLLWLTLLACFCLFWFSAFTSDGAVPTSPRARWPSRGAGERHNSSLGPCTLPHSPPGPATTLCPIRAALWFLTSSLVLQRESKLMGADSKRHCWAAQEMGKSRHCAALWYKSWKFPFLILMYICKIVNQCLVCCTRKREKSLLLHSQQAALCKHSASHTLVLAQSRKNAPLWQRLATLAQGSCFLKNSAAAFPPSLFSRLYCHESGAHFT